MWWASILSSATGWRALCCESVIPPFNLLPQTLQILSVISSFSLSFVCFSGVFHTLCSSDTKEGNEFSLCTCHSLTFIFYNCTNIPPDYSAFMLLDPLRNPYFRTYQQISFFAAWSQAFIDKLFPVSVSCGWTERARTHLKKQNNTTFKWLFLDKQISRKCTFFFLPLQHSLARSGDL